MAVSSSATSIAGRIVRLVGRPELGDTPWFATGHGRVEHADEIDAAEAAAAPVYDAADILHVPHLQSTGAIASFDDDELGPIVMTGPIARLSATPASILDDAEVEGLGARGVIP